MTTKLVIEVVKGLSLKLFHNAKLIRSYFEPNAMHEEVVNALAELKITNVNELDSVVVVPPAANLYLSWQVALAVAAAINVLKTRSS